MPGLALDWRTGCYLSRLLARGETATQPSKEKLVAHGEDDRANKQADDTHGHESTNRAKKNDDDGNGDTPAQ
jgi:hypothetical protein